MTVENSATIDAIGVDRQTGAIHLSIVDSLPWDLTHLQFLQEKINTYLGFIESGEVYDAYPEAKRRQLVIDIVARFRPNEDAWRFLEQAKTVIENYGATMLLRHAGEGFSDDSA